MEPKSPEVTPEAAEVPSGARGFTLNRFKVSESTSEDGKQTTSDEDGTFIKGAWAVKESGQKDIFGKHNWRQRYFELRKIKQFAVFSYFVRQEDSTPKGSVRMTNEYIARELETVRSKGRFHCFALGPLIDSGLRTYYISCASEEDMLEWILIINSTLEGCKPEKLIKRKSTYRIRGRHKLKVSSSGTIRSDHALLSEKSTYRDYEQRLKQWHKLCGIVSAETWKHEDVKSGVSVSRQKFSKSDIAYFKIQGIVNAKPEVIYEYLYRSLSNGGKLDMLFRMEEVYDKITDGKTTTYFARTEYDVPIPAVKNRDMCYFKMWLPPGSTNQKQIGMVIQSVPHEESDDFVRVDLGLSGLVISPFRGNYGSSTVVIVMGVDLEDALQNMMRGAFKTGILRGALRRMFIEIVKKVEKYNRLLFDIKE